MRNLYKYLLIAITLMACSETKTIVVTEEEIRQDSIQKYNEHYNTLGLKIVIIDGCEYITRSSESNYIRYNAFLSHKGNCKNPIHCYNKKIK